MTLRTRLVAALVALAALGLVVFGVATSALYGRSLDRQLDDSLQANARGQGARLLAIAATTEIDPTTCAPVGSDGTPTFVGPGPAPGQGLDAYTELRAADGTVAACSRPVSSEGVPDLPAQVDLGPDGTATFDAGSASGSGTWRVLALAADQVPQPRGPGSPTSPSGPTAETTDRATDDATPIELAGGGTSAGAIVLVATRTDGVQSSLAGLQRIELIAAIALLAALGGGAWLVLRRGLHPLESMAATATTITAGDLTQRVEPAEDRTEVGQLGLALNTMLDGIEAAFLERDATEARLRQFLADASHELRTPLTSIQGYAELYRLAEAGAAGPESRPLHVPPVMARIEQESTRMRTLVEDLLLLARLDEPTAAPHEPVDLALVAAEACTSVAALAVDHPLSLEAPAPAIVEGVGAHLHRAVTNLVANAIKHTPPGTAIEVTVTADAGTRQAAIVVRDHGPGLPAEGVEHAFDRFWQADAARVGHGSGLGLAIVAGIAAEHGGRATAANAPDGGAAFTIELPLSGPEGSGSATEA